MAELLDKGNKAPNIVSKLIVVDVQNDFADQSRGSLYVPGGESTVPHLNEIAEEIRRTSGQVIYTRDWHPEKTPHFEKWPRHCVADTWGAEFHGGLDVDPGDIIINKGTEQTDGYSGWEGTANNSSELTLKNLLTPEKREIISLYIGGLATDYCVRATGLDVLKNTSRDRVVVHLLTDAIRAVDPIQGDVAIKEMVDAGALEITTAEAIERIRGGWL